MAEQQITYTDGSAYERSMARWSQLAGEAFLGWLSPSSNLSWIDVGCGTGAFTELLATRCKPRAVTGIDPADAQLAYARSRPACGVAEFRKGDAMSLPFPDDSFDAAVMALVIFFVPDPARGVAEMARVVRPGGIVSAYAWDMMNGGFPFNAMQIAMREMGIPPTYPPSVEASRIEAMRELWMAAGLASVETNEYTVRRTYDDFEDLFVTNSHSAAIAPKLKAIPPADIEVLKSRLRDRFPADTSGRIACTARVTAVRGQVPN
jgi:ubiquinone/menaquinone biosynthesis C-methylase UbiE